MSETPSYAPPAGPPPGGAAPPPGSPAPGGGGGYAPPAGPPPTAQQPYGAYPPPPGQPPYGYPYYPPQGYYPPPPGPPGAYPPPAGYPPYGGYPGYYPPPAGYPPPGGAPAVGTPGAEGASANGEGQAAGQGQGQYAPPPGPPPPPGGGYYPPPPAGYPPYGYGAYGAPPPPQAHVPGPGGEGFAGGFAQPSPSPSAPPASALPPLGGSGSVSSSGAPVLPPIAGLSSATSGSAGTATAAPYPPTASVPKSTDPLNYLGAAIPDPYAHAAPVGQQKVKGYDPAHDYNALVRASAGGSVSDAGFGVFTQTLINLNPFQMDALNDYAIGKTGKGLASMIEKLQLGNYGAAARALTLGPLGYDIDLAHKALVGFGTNERMLIELLLGRPAYEVRWLKTGYKLRYGKDLVDVVKGDLSGKLENLFVMALHAQKPVDLPSTVVDQKAVLADIEALNSAAKHKNEQPFFEILVNRGDRHIGAVIHQFSTRYKSLSKIIKKTFSGDIEAALLHIVHGVKPKRDGRGVWRDAKNLEKTMAGLGTKDALLVTRLVRAHWDRGRMREVKEAYTRRFGKTLEHRVKGETSGAYRDLLVAVVGSADK